MTTALAVLGLLAGIGVQEQALSPRDYRARLGLLAAALDRGEIDRVRSDARDLLSLRVRHPGVDLPTDATLLGPLSLAADLEEASRLRGRLASLLSALEGAESPGEGPVPDHTTLERLRREEAAREIGKGGAVARLPEAPPVPRSFAERVRDFFEWIWEKVKSFFRWLWRMFFPDRAGGGSSAGMPLYVSILVILLLIAVSAVAIVALRRRQSEVRPSGAASAPAANPRDEDPLSRTASEWERFAAELARAGRYREAIRAWYHAVLVSLFRAGVLHYRKDRTNWEYAYALAPQHAWRPEFLDATRRFEQEWYGRRNTPEEAAGEYERQARRILAVVRERAVE
jgi:hypothetical protein